MEWYANEWCVTLEELTRDDRTEADQSEQLAPVVSLPYYKKLCRQGRIKLARQGGGKGNYVLVSLASLPEAMQAKLRAKYPDMEARQSREKNPAYELFRRAYERDYEALAYYHTTLRELNKSLSKERIDELAEEYTINASVIKAVMRIRRENELYRKVRGKRVVSWADMSDVIRFYQSELGHTLGVSPTRFATWVRAFERDGYGALISKKFGNMNTLKVNMDVEKLLIELACDPHRPYGRTVWEWYMDFRLGEVEIYSKATGESYNPSHYPDISEKTVGDILSRPTVQAILSKRHDVRHDYMTMVRPSHKRQKPKYSLSMVSLDDKDFTLKVASKSGDKPIVISLKAYLCYDVASEAIIGYAFSTDKKRELFEDCLRNMYRNLLDMGLGQPHEAQVENHLVSLYKETSMREGHLFRVVSWAGAENSQEKYAERYNWTLKYKYEKYALDEAVGRHYAKLSTNRTKNNRVSDEHNNRYKRKVYSFEDAVAIYIGIIERYNNAPHPNKKLYGDKTRLEVLKTCVHPEIKPIDMLSLARWAGRSTKTSLKRGVITANYSSYSVSPEVQDRLRGRDGKVEAYWWEQEDYERDLPMVYLYQDDVYLCECPRVVPYMVSKLEKTDEDNKLFAEQRKRLVAWDKAVEERQPEGIVMIDREASEAIERAPIQTVAIPIYEDAFELEELEQTDYVSRARAEL